MKTTGTNEIASLGVGVKTSKSVTKTNKTNKTKSKQERMIMAVVRLRNSEVLFKCANYFHGAHWEINDGGARVVEMKRYEDGSKVSS